MVIHISLLIILWHAEHTAIAIRLVSSIDTIAIYLCGKISLAIMDIEEDSHDSVPKMMSGLARYTSTKWSCK